MARIASLIFRSNRVSRLSEAELILEIARELLGQRARALRAPALDDVGDGGGARCARR